MQSTASSVDDYITEAPAERQAALHRLRDLCRQYLRGHVEVMQYGMAGYNRGGVVAVAFASQKNYISLYILKQEVLDAHRDELVGVSVGKGCIRYSQPARINFDLVGRLLQATCVSVGPVC